MNSKALHDGINTQELDTDMHQLIPNVIPESAERLSGIQKIQYLWVPDNANAFPA